MEINVCFDLGNQLDKKNIKNKTGKRWPSSIKVYKKKRLKILYLFLKNYNDYELDSWGFVLKYYWPKDYEINLVASFPDRNIAKKWFVCLKIRLQFMHANSGKRPFRLFIYTDKLLEVLIPNTPVTSSAYHHYNYLELEDRKRKHKHDEEQKIQWDIGLNIEKNNPGSEVVFEMPFGIVTDVNCRVKQSDQLSIDIVHFNTHTNQIDVIEVKAPGKNQLDIIPQLMDYYIYYFSLVHNFNDNNLLSMPNNMKSVNAYTATTAKHPFYEILKSQYLLHGFQFSEWV